MRVPAIIPVLAATTAAQALVSFAMLAPPAIAPELARALGVNPRLVGWWVSIAYGGAMLTSLIGGGLVRRLGAARTTQLALLLSASGMLVTAAGWLPMLALGSVLAGLGYGLTNPAASHVLARATRPASRNLVFSIKQTGVPLGGTMAGLVTPPVALAFGWPAAIALVAALALVVAVLLFPARSGWDADRDPTARPRGNPLSGLSQVWRSPRLKALSLTGFSYAALQLSLSTFLVTMLVAELGWTLVEAGVLLSSVQVAGVVGRLILGGAADRLGGGVGTLVAIGALSAGLALATGLLGPAWPKAAVFLILVPFGAAALGWNGVYLAEIAHAAPPDQIGRLTGLSLFFTYGGVLVGPPAFAGLQQLTGSWTGTYALAALPAVVGMVLLLRERRG